MLDSRNEMYKISVLVPVYGVEHYIERCARSLFKQTYPNLEYVFVNDCTPDRSVEILRQVLENYPNRADSVKIINHNTNQGIAAARNTLLDNAVGDFVCFVDSDDWLEFNAIELLVKKLEEADADLVSGNRMVHYQGQDSLLFERKYQSREEMVLRMMQRSCDHFITGRLFRRFLFFENNLRWNEGLDLAEDRYMMTLLTYYAKSCEVVDDVIYHYERRNINSFTMNDNLGKVLKNNRQELGNVLALERFFKDKEVVFQKECARCVMEQLEFNMKYALAYSDREEFYDITSIIDGRNYVDLNYIDWEKAGIKGWFLHNYFLMRLDWLKGKTIRFVRKKMKCKNYFKG